MENTSPPMAPLTADSPNTEAPLAGTPSDKPPPPARTGWIGWSAIAGCVVGIPAGVLLAYLAALPFLLGLFFYLLLGLVIGATMYRFGAKARIPSKPTLWAIGLGVALVTLAASLWAEYRALPGSVTEAVRHSLWMRFDPDMKARLETETRQFAAHYLQEHYPPGGVLGYVRWAISDGSLKCPRVFKESTTEYRLPQRRKLWVVRITLASVMLGWTILVQVLGLVPRSRPEVESDVPPTGSEPNS